VNVSILDNDLYKFSMQQAVCSMFPRAEARYELIWRRNIPTITGKMLAGIGSRLNALEDTYLRKEEKKFLKTACPFLTPVYLDFLEGYRFDPKNEVEVDIDKGNKGLKITVIGPWYRTILWEVPLLAMVSEIICMEQNDYEPPWGMEKTISHAREKAEVLKNNKIKFADFGTRRRFSTEVHMKVTKAISEVAQDNFVGTSNLLLAKNLQLRPIGTQAHEWFMYHGATFGYRQATELALKHWSNVYHGDLGIALTDTYTSDVFFDSFGTFYAKLFDGIRHDSGDAIVFTEKAIEHYKLLSIDPTTKTIVFSDGLNVDDCIAINRYCLGKIRCSFGIGTNLTNDCGANPLDVVMKMVACRDSGKDWLPTVKLSDIPGKNTGDEEEVKLCKKQLNINQLS